MKQTFRFITNWRKMVTKCMRDCENRSCNPILGAQSWKLLIRREEHYKWWYAAFWLIVIVVESDGRACHQTVFETVFVLFQSFAAAVPVGTWPICRGTKVTTVGPSAERLTFVSCGVRWNSVCPRRGDVHADHRRVVHLWREKNTILSSLRVLPRYAIPKRIRKRTFLLLSYLLVLRSVFSGTDSPFKAQNSYCNLPHRISNC